MDEKGKPVVKRGGRVPGRIASLVPPEAQAAHNDKTRRALQTAIADDYVELVADLIEVSGEARAVDIARRLGVTNATVAKTIARLQQDGLVVAEPYRSIFLTPRGKKIAAASKRRHEIVVAFLKSIGVSDETARADAEGLEHHVSDETLAAFQRLTDGGR